MLTHTAVWFVYDSWPTCQVLDAKDWNPKNEQYRNRGRAPASSGYAYHLCWALASTHSNCNEKGMTDIVGHFWPVTLGGTIGHVLRDSLDGA